MLNLHNVKLLHNRIIVRLMLIAFLVSGATLPTLFPIPIGSPLPLTEVEALDCPPRGLCHCAGNAFDWIANGSPTDSSCWSVSNAFLTTTTTCSSFTNQITDNAWEFNYAGVVSQSVTLPLTATAPNFSFSYYLDFDDPHNDGANNKLFARVLDQTTGTYLAAESFAGHRGDYYCARRDNTWTGNLAGHTLLVYFSGTKGYTDTHIRVFGISLWQSP